MSCVHFWFNYALTSFHPRINLQWTLLKVKAENFKTFKELFIWYCCNVSFRTTVGVMIPSKTFSRIWKCGGGFTLINKTNLSLSFCNICLLCGQNRSTRHFSKGLYTWRWGTPGRWGNPPNRGRKIKCVYMQSYNPGVLGWGFLRLLLRLQLRSLSRGVPSSHLEKDERLILGHIRTHESVTCCVTRCLVSRVTVD